MSECLVMPQRSAPQAIDIGRAGKLQQCYTIYKRTHANRNLDKIARRDINI